MRPNYREVAFLLGLLTFAGGASAAQRKVLVTAGVNVDPYTELWTDAGMLEELKSSLVTAARSRLQEEYAYLAWVDSGDADATLLLSVEEAQKSPRPPGARPWVIRLVLTSGKTTVEHDPPLPLADLDEVSALDTKAAGSKKELVDAFTRQFPQLFVQATSEAFVSDVLSEISIADGIEEHGAHVLITVPYGDLHTTRLSVLDTDFHGTPPGEADLTVGLQLNPLKAYDVRTECAADSTDSVFRNVDQRNLYVQNAQKPVRIFVTKYDRQKGSRKEGDRVTEQQR